MGLSLMVLIAKRKSSKATYRLQKPSFKIYLITKGKLRKKRGSSLAIWVGGEGKREMEGGGDGGFEFYVVCRWFVLPDRNLHTYMYTFYNFFQIVHSKRSNFISGLFLPIKYNFTRL